MPPLALASPSEAGAGPGQAHIPGYTGYQPGKREKFGLSSTEASREILANLTSTEDFHPLIPLEGKRPDSVYDAHIDKDGIASVMDGFAMTEKGNVGAKVIVNAGFTPAYLKHEKEAQARQLAHSDPHARAPFGVDPTGTSLGKVDYTTTSSDGAGKFSKESMASRLARRRLDRPRNEAGRIYRPDEFYD
uniref:Uncharacterized protein n=1 Tax=Prymnesium polylepis TaxID=72548 RepID=A0A7S4HU35_9EUKA